jgi:hypothetical protein
MKYYCYDNFTKDLRMRNLQILYLYYIEDLKPSQISQIVGLAPSTITSYRNKYYEMLDEAEELFTNKANSKTYDMKGDYANVLFANSKNTNKFYLLKVTDLYSGELIASKIGTTIRPIYQRVSEIEKDYSNMYNRKVYIEVERVYDCGKLTPILFESFFRYQFILKYPSCFVENDRFKEVEFNYSESDKLYEKLIKEIEKIALV